MARQNSQNKLGNQRHEWKERDEEGNLIIYRAIHHASDWRVIWSYKVGRSEEAVWNDLEEVTPEVWQTLRDILWRKYQRGRVPFDLVEAIDKRLAKDS